MKPTTDHLRHGATMEGSALLAAEMRYSRDPNQERQYRAAAVAFARELAQHPEIIASQAAKFIEGAAEEIGKGPIPERSGTLATGSIRNASVAIVSASFIAALPIAGGALLGFGGAAGGTALAMLAGEALKKSKTFEPIRDAIAQGIDRVPSVDIERLQKTLQPHLDFFLRAKTKLANLAARDESLRWLKSAGDWLVRRKPVETGQSGYPRDELVRDLEILSDIMDLIRQDVRHDLVIEEIGNRFKNLRATTNLERGGEAFVVWFPAGHSIGIRRSRRADGGIDVAAFSVSQDLNSAENFDPRLLEMLVNRKLK